MEKYKIFYYGEKELGGYTLRGTFKGEEEATKELFASEYKIAIEDIKVVIEER